MDNKKSPYRSLYIGAFDFYDFDEQTAADIIAYVNRLRAKSAGTGPSEGGSIPDATGDSIGSGELVRAGIQRSEDFERVDLQSISTDLCEPDPTIRD